MLYELAAAGAKTCACCFPRAILGGSMHNNVVEAVCDSFSERGISTCRFNCRGIGGSRQVCSSLSVIHLIRCTYLNTFYPKL